MPVMSQLKIREMPRDERPREKLLSRGPDALTNPELIAILLRTGRQGMNVIEVARELLNKYKSFAELSRCSVKELREIKGIGPAKALDEELSESPFGVVEIVRRIHRTDQVVGADALVEGRDEAGQASVANGGVDVCIGHGWAR